MLAPFQILFTFSRAPVQLLFHEFDAETAGNDYRAHVLMTSLGQGEWKADVLLIESQDGKEWRKDALPRDEIELIEAHMVEMYESEELEVAWQR
jgi:hypothetical protein